MKLLSVRGQKIIDSSGKEVSLRGACLGGWMNLENFINGFPGCESGLRREMANTIGEDNSRYFFERLLDEFFSDADAAFIGGLGANVLRVALNYRHFETDECPFSYKESGFRRLDSLLASCERRGVYVILDMHAVPGWQNAHWHSDNENAVSLFWQSSHYQERTIRLWKEIAGRYRGRSVVAGYELLNEPVSNTPAGDLPHMYFDRYKPNWVKMNQVYKELVSAIREIDPEHIIFIEGDRYGQLFEGFDEPFADNLVYSCHGYSLAGFGPGVYPGRFGGIKTDEVADGGDYIDRNQQRLLLEKSSGARFCSKHKVPLWVGEFGSQYNTGSEDLPYRVAAMNDQLSIYNEWGAHWTTWTYKDMGVMGWVTLNPESEYSQLVAPIQKMKTQLGAENFVGWQANPPGKQASRALAKVIEDTIGEGAPPLGDIASGLSLFALTGYAAACLQPSYCRLFKGMTKGDLDRILASFAFENCHINEPYKDILKERLVDL